MSDASFETESINSKELNFLSNVSIGLTQNSDPADIIESLSESFRQMINLENLNIYIYDDNTQTLRDYAKSWIVIDEIHDKDYTEKLYHVVKTSKYDDFLINDNSINIKDFSDIDASKFNGSVVAPVGFCTALLCVGLLFFLTFTFMDRKFDSQLVEAGLMTAEKSPEDEFHLSDLGKIFSSKMFWIVALLCVLYYSAIFPFQRYAPNYLEITLGVSAETASRLFSCFPILAMVLTPFLGAFLDFKGKGASMLMLGAIIMIVCHLSFAFLLPAFPSKALALVLIVTLGVSFSLVPAALWPSVPKIIDEKILGSAYCLIFWVQNIGLCLVPLLIGATLQATGGYMVPMIIFSTFGVLAFILSFMLKFEDRKKGYGLELPNVKE